MNLVPFHQNSLIFHYGSYEFGYPTPGQITP